MDNLFEMARKAFVRGLVESTPPRLVIETQMEVIAEQAQELTRQARILRDQAEASYRQICCGGACNQGHECPLEGLK